MSEEAVIYGAKDDEATKNVQAFLEDKKIAFKFVDINEDSVGETIVKEMNDGQRKIPMLVTPQGSFLTQPSEDDLKKAFP
jgi:mycoredoxin